MSKEHLTTGSQNPPKTEGKLRLYSMRYCPYAQRPRLVLKAKGIPHEIVNINLFKKPEWYFSIHPEGKVPALDTGSEIIVESLDICDYLEEKYPEPALYPIDPEIKKEDKDLIKQISNLTDVFYKCVLNPKEKTADEWREAFLPCLDVFEKKLTERATTYFGGDQPCMVDYMLWPWAERAGIIGLAMGEKLPFKDDELVQIRKWRKAMRSEKVVDEIFEGPEKYWKVVLIKLNNTSPEEVDKIE